MHNWGKEGVDWSGLNEAPWYIGSFLRRWGRISVSDTKEKFGTVRVYCHFGWDCIHSIVWPGYMWIHKWWPYRLDLMISAWLLPILNKVAIPYQKWLYAKRYNAAVRKWPHLYNEIVSCADWGELFEGVVPGYKHSHYWEEVK